MYPILFKIPYLGREVPTFGVMMTLGFFLAIWWAMRRGFKSGANPDVIINMGFISLIGGVLGCRIMYAWHYWDTQFARLPTTTARIFAVLDLTQGGMEFYGGFIAAVIGVLVYLRLWGHSTRWYLDIVAPSCAIGMAIGRIGCFFNGCCFGGPCDLPWKVKFPYGSNPAFVQWERRLPGAELPAELIYLSDNAATPTPIQLRHLMAADSEIESALAESKKLRAELTELFIARDKAANDAERKSLEDKISKLNAVRTKLPFYDVRQQLERYDMTLPQLRELAHEHPSLPVHPTQLYSTLGLTALALFLNSLYYRRARDGVVILTLLTIEAPSRFLLEVIRKDNPLDTFGLTISQSIALSLTVIGALGLIYLRTLPARSSRAKIWIPEDEPAKAK